MDQVHVRCRLIPKDAYCLVSLSGGKDSMVLLHALHTFRSIEVIHIDHAQHEASQRIASEVQDYVKQLGLLCHVYRLHVPTGASETVLRKARYDALGEHMPQDGFLCMGHHGQDDIETFFLNMMRPTSVRNVIGIPAYRKTNHYTIVRPLKDVSRHAIDTYHAEHVLPVWEDPSNADIGIVRNYLRHRVIPFLQTQCPEMQRGIKIFQKQLADVQRWADHAVHAAVRQTTQGHLLIHHAMQKYSATEQRDIIYSMCHGLGYTLSQARCHVILRHLLQTAACDCVEGLWVMTRYGYTCLYEGSITMSPERMDMEINTHYAHLFGTFISHQATTITTGRLACSSSACLMHKGVKTKKNAQQRKILQRLRAIWPVLHHVKGCQWWMPDSQEISLVRYTPLGQMVMDWCHEVARCDPLHGDRSK